MASYEKPIRNLGVTLLLLLAGSAASLSFTVLGLESEVSFLFFIMGIMIASVETDSSWWGFALGVMYLLAYDLLFTAPHFNLSIFDQSDLAALLIFMVVAMISGSMTNRLRKQVSIVEKNARNLKRLNTISSGLIDSISVEGACEFVSIALGRALGRVVEIDLGKPDPDGREGKEALAARDCYEQGCRTGAGVSGYAGCTSLYIPLSAKTRVYGVVSVDMAEGELDEEALTLVDSVITQTVIAVERNELEEHAREDALRIERERFKTSLFLGVSHDLRTPLVSIQGNAELLERSFDSISPEERKVLLSAISGDARWLAGMIDNLLGMTRVQDDEVPLHFQPEVVDDVISDAVTRVISHIGNHSIEVSQPDDVVLVEMDGRLIRQVLVNLIENAIRHSEPSSLITVEAEREGNCMAFRVSDNGGGIAPDMLDSVFDRFVSGKPLDRRNKGIGLGLSVCKAIVEAHDGTIRAFNNDSGGATFEFFLPEAHVASSVDVQTGGQEGASEWHTRS